MRCYRCDSTDLPLAALWPHQRQLYKQFQIILRQCQHCGLEQNHYGDDETIGPDEAATIAPSRNPR